MILSGKDKPELAMRRDAAKRVCSAILLTAVLTAAGGSLAQTPRSAAGARARTVPPSLQRIEGCSSVIKAARESGENLAEAFNNRGMAYRLKGDLDRAIQDYGQAIKLNGSSPRSTTIAA